MNVPDERGGGGLVIGVQEQEEKVYHEIWYDDGDVGLLLLDSPVAMGVGRDWSPVSFIASMVGTAATGTTEIQRRKKPATATTASGDGTATTATTDHTFDGYVVDSNGFLTGAPEQDKPPPPATQLPQEAPQPPPQRASTNWL